MSKLFANTFRFGLGVLINVFLIENIALAGESPDALSQTSNSLEPASSLEQSDRYTQNNHLKQANSIIHLADDTRKSEALAQVTFVSQLSDVQPTDWAFQALQFLVKRYGCIAGYPDTTFRGNRALTRYEFAAGLNACLEKVNELIARASGENVTKENLTTAFQWENV